jgi:hypothetical protein
MLIGYTKTMTRDTGDSVQRVWQHIHVGLGNAVGEIQNSADLTLLLERPLLQKSHDVVPHILYACASHNYFCGSLASLLGP